MDETQPTPKLGGTSDSVTPEERGLDPVLWDLAAAVDRLRLPVDTDVLAGVLSIEDQLASLTSTLVGEVAASDLFEDDGAASMRGWLADRGNMTSRRATAVAKTAKRLRSCPVTHMAWLSGQLSGGQIDAIVANLSDRVAGLWAEHEADLVPSLAPLSATDTARMMTAWKTKADAIADGDKPAVKPNHFHFSRTLDGRHVGNLDLDADMSAVLRAALAEAMPAHNREEPAPLSQRQADGLLELASFYLNAHSAKGRRNRPHLNLTMTLEDFLSGRGGFDTETGDPISAELIAAAACEAEIHRVVLNTHNAVLIYGRSTRVVPHDLRTTISIRDLGCRWPGCHRPAHATEIHHIKAWQHGGTTDYTNLVMLCSQHHHMLHRDDWHLELDPTTSTVKVWQTGKPPRLSRPRPQPGTLTG